MYCAEFTIDLHVFASGADYSPQYVVESKRPGHEHVARSSEHLFWCPSLDDSATSQGTSERYEGVVKAVEELVAVEGAVVTIDVVVDEVVDAVVVPIAAVLTDGPEDKVRVATPDGIVRKTIQTGMLDGAWVEVVDGVSPGEYVILEIDRS